MIAQVCLLQVPQKEHPEVQAPADNREATEGQSCGVWLSQNVHGQTEETDV